MARKSFLCLCTCLALFLPAGAGHSQTSETCGGTGALQCPAGEACRFDFDKCNVPDLAGICVRVPATCAKQGPPICGCDGKTYPNECELLKAGVRPAKHGACGQGEGSSDNTAKVRRLPEVHGRVPGAEVASSAIQTPAKSGLRWSRVRAGWCYHSVVEASQGTITRGRFPCIRKTENPR